MIIKINKKEYNLLETDAPEDSDLIVTCGEEGAFYREKNFPSEKVEVADVCGAGDTFLSALCYKFLQTSNLDCAIKFAIKASSLTVQKLGVYAPSLKEIT
jgi:D-beta-D-heptose 7-phosphate kinase/D-beta-D-heptose 1-phosphate adenosyltransferase